MNNEIENPFPLPLNATPPKWDGILRLNAIPPKWDETYDESVRDTLKCAQKKYDEEDTGKRLFFLDFRTGTIVCEDGVLRRNLRDDFERFGEQSFREGLASVFACAYILWVREFGRGCDSDSVWCGYIAEPPELYDQELYGMLPDVPVDEDSGIPVPATYKLSESQMELFQSITDEWDESSHVCGVETKYMKAFLPNIGYTFRNDTTSNRKVG